MKCRHSLHCVAALTLAALLVGCATAPVAPAAAVVQTDQSLLQTQPQRLIVIAVANPTEPVAVRAGSTLRGYDSIPRYAEGGHARATLAALAADYGLREVVAWPIPVLALHCVVFEIPPQADPAALLSALAKDRRVRLAQPLQRFDTFAAAYNDPYLGLQRGFAEIDAADAQVWSRGDGVRVAIVDTGVDTQHPDLAGRIAGQRNFVDDNAQQFAQDRHGTEVAGIIGAVANNGLGIVGVAPGARVLALKACWETQGQADSAQCNSFTLAEALSAAIQARAQIINLSLGGPADPLLTQLVDYAIGHGIVVVGAVPPDGRLDGFPLGVPGVIAVDTTGRPALNGRVLHAPGREVLTLSPGGHYDFASGSSLAAAHVSGAIALLLATDAGLDPARLYALLSRGGADAADGMASVNVCTALAALRASPGCTTTSAALSTSGASPTR